MQTNERNRRHQSAKSPQRRRRTTAGSKSAGSAAREARRAAVQRVRTKPKPQRQRTVQPPREDIPQVVYTSPQPLHRGRFLLRLVSVVAVVLAVVLCLSVFFRVENIYVSGTQKYTPWMVRQASGIQEGESLLSLSKAKAASRILKQLDYVDEVRIGINLPGTVNIEIKELEVVYAIQAIDNTWWLISCDGRVVEQVDAAGALGYTQVLGVRADAPRAGQTVQAGAAIQTEPTETAEPSESQESTQETQPTQITTPPAVDETDDSAQRLQAALTILRELEDSGVIGKVVSVNVASATELSLDYDGRIQVLLGDGERLSYKISYMAQALKQLEDYETGELDVSFAFYDEALFEPAE